MKVRKTAFVLLLVIISTSLEWEDKAKVIAAVTNEENLSFIQNTKLINEESKEGYILLNKHKDKNIKEYLNAYFTYNENGLYVDGMDALPLELFENKESYLSIGIDSVDGYIGHHDQFGFLQVLDLGTIKMTLTEDPIYWRVVNENGVYQTSQDELADSDYIRKLLPETLEGFKGYMMVQADKDLTIPYKIDLVPFNKNDTERIFGINEFVNANNLLYNERLYQFVLKGSKESAELMITANYYFQITLLNNKAVEGKFTFTKNYIVSK